MQKSLNHKEKMMITTWHNLSSCEIHLLPIWGAKIGGKKIYYSTLKLFRFRRSCAYPFWAVKLFRPWTSSLTTHTPPSLAYSLLSHTFSPSSSPTKTLTSVHISPSETCQGNHHSWCNAGWGRKREGGLPVWPWPLCFSCFAPAFASLFSSTAQRPLDPLSL